MTMPLMALAQLAWGQEDGMSDERLRDRHNSRLLRIEHIQEKYKMSGFAVFNIDTMLSISQYISECYADGKDPKIEAEKQIARMLKAQINEKYSPAPLTDAQRHGKG